MKSATNAFTLLELSIVLVIIGLIIGGIIAGGELVKSAELNRSIKDFGKIQTAIHSFRYKYGAWPGDMSTATSYWPTGTTNGNGNGRIGFGDLGSYEHFAAFEHLSRAELLEGGYDYTSQIECDPTVCPATARSGYFLLHAPTIAVFGKTNVNSLQVGRPTPGSAGAWDAWVSPQDAHVIDRKMDDGVANEGKLIAFDGENAVGTCSAALNTAGADYDLQNSEVACRVWLWLE